VLGWLGGGDVRVEPDVLHEHDVKDGSSQELLMPWFLLRMGGGASYLDRAFIMVLSLLDLSLMLCDYKFLLKGSSRQKGSQLDSLVSARPHKVHVPPI
jgi:hypothetical protein